MSMHIWNLSTWEAETGGLWVPEQPVSKQTYLVTDQDRIQPCTPTIPLADFLGNWGQSRFSGTFMFVCAALGTEPGTWHSERGQCCASQAPAPVFLFGTPAEVTKGDKAFEKISSSCFFDGHKSLRLLPSAPFSYLLCTKRIFLFKVLVGMATLT